MNIVIITTGKRHELLRQTIGSLTKNAEVKGEHTYTVVFDGDYVLSCPAQPNWTLIQNSKPQGASAARNIGASSIPKYRRQKYVMFLDDDVYMCPKWDWTILSTLSAAKWLAVSGHAHPFNHPIAQYEINHVGFESAGVLSTVNIAMPWAMWDEVGWFVEPGGPGGSEDVDWCKRATEKGYGLAVTVPQCVIHCGLMSSSGKQIVGYDLMMEQNKKLIKAYGLEGVVIE